MSLFINLKQLLLSSVLFIKELPRKHLFALIILFVFVMVLAFIPLGSKNKGEIKRNLKLPNNINKNFTAEPLESIPLLEQNNLQQKEHPVTPQNKQMMITIKQGDTLSDIFQKEKLSAATLQKLLDSDLQYTSLGNLVPGQKINLLISPSEELLSLQIFLDLANSITFTLKENEYIAQLETKEGEWKNTVYRGIITGSFYINAKKAGLSAGQIQQISEAMQDKFNFNRELRQGDTFSVLVAKQYIDGQYIFESEVLAIIIKTKNQKHMAFLNEDGRYYDNYGKSLSNAFRRLPTKKRYRISSSFNLKRLHPITKKIRPHLGTDFATPIGTKIYSVGDGIVLRAGYHPAAGNYIVIKHGRKYTTRFLHLSKILVRKGQRVKMGKLIGKTGNSGRSTGAHLHYEFHVYNKAVNVMKVRLPLSYKVPKKQIEHFNKRKDLYLKELELNII